MSKYEYDEQAEEEYEEDRRAYKELDQYCTWILENKEEHRKWILHHAFDDFYELIASHGKQDEYNECIQPI